MKYAMKYVSLLLVSMSAFSIAGERVDQSLPTDGVNRITIDNPRGKVKIIGWDKASVSIAGELDDKAKKLIFEQKGSRIKIKVVVPNQHQYGHNNNRDGSNLTIKMPENIRMEFESIAGDVSVSELIAGTEIETVSGNIAANDLKEYLDFETVSGDIEIESATGKVHLSSVSGNIDSSNLSGDIKLSTISGDIEDKNSQGQIQLKVVSGNIKSQSSASEVGVKNISGNTRLSLAEVDEFSASVVSGDLTASLELNNDGYVKASGVSGDISLEFQRDIQASFKLSATAGGDIDNDISSDKPVKAKYGPSRKLQFQTGNANGSVNVSTVSGEISLTK